MSSSAGSHDGISNIRRRNGLSPPYSKAQLSSWFALLVTWVEFVVFVTPILPNAISSIVLTLFFTALVFLTAYYGIMTQIIDPTDLHLMEFIRSTSITAQPATTPNSNNTSNNDDNNNNNGANFEQEHNNNDNIDHSELEDDVGMVGTKRKKEPKFLESLYDRYNNNRPANGTRQGSFSSMLCCLPCLACRGNDGGGRSQRQPSKMQQQQPELPVEPMKQCWICDTQVAEHSMHCKFCNKCVYHFDHHCFWLNTCVGSANYYYFFRTMLYLVTLEFVHFMIQLGLVVDIFAHGSTYDRAKQWLGNANAVNGILIAFVVFSGLSVFMVGQLLMFHMKLHREQLTTYQYIVNDHSKKREKAKIDGDIQNKRIHAIMAARQAGQRGDVLRLQMGGMFRSWGCERCDPLSQPPPPAMQQQLQQQEPPSALSQQPSTMSTPRGDEDDEDGNDGAVDEVDGDLELQQQQQHRTMNGDHDDHGKPRHKQEQQHGRPHDVEEPPLDMSGNYMESPPLLPPASPHRKQQQQQKQEQQREQQYDRRIAFFSVDDDRAASNTNDDIYNRKDEGPSTAVSDDVPELRDEEDDDGDYDADDDAAQDDDENGTIAAASTSTKTTSTTTTTIRGGEATTKSIP